MPRRLRRESATSYKLHEDAINVATGGFLGGPFDYAANHAMYDPAESQRVPEAGAWAMIVRQLPGIEGGIDQHVTPGRVFFLEREAATDKDGFNASGAYKVRTRTAWGTVSLWPHEYRVINVETIIALWQDGSLRFHPTAIDDARLNDITFYARSRGIPLAVAAPMALGNIMAPIGWFEADDEVAEYVDMLGRMGGPLTEENHARRRAARARRGDEPRAALTKPRGRPRRET